MLDDFRVEFRKVWKEHELTLSREKASMNLGKQAELQKVLDDRILTLTLERNDAEERCKVHGG